MKLDQSVDRIKGQVRERRLISWNLYAAMVAIEFNDIFGPCIITSLSAIQQCNFAHKVGRARKKFKIPVPETTGEEGFVRVFRAHQNSVEFYPVFLATLWSSSMLFHQGPPVALSLLYIAGRSMYFRGYSEAAEKRLPGFKLCTFSLVGMAACSLIGVGNHLIVQLTGKSLLRLLLH